MSWRLRFKISMILVILQCNNSKWLFLVGWWYFWWKPKATFSLPHFTTLMWLSKVKLNWKKPCYLNSSSNSLIFKGSGGVTDVKTSQVCKLECIAAHAIPPEITCTSGGWDFADSVNILFKIILDTLLIACLRCYSWWGQPGRANWTDHFHPRVSLYWHFLLSKTQEKKGYPISQNSNETFIFRNKRIHKRKKRKQQMETPTTNTSTKRQSSEWAKTDLIICRL